MPDRHQSPAIDNQDCEAPNIAAGQSFAQVPNLAQTEAELRDDSQKAIVNKAVFDQRRLMSLLQIERINCAERLIAGWIIRWA